MKKAKLIIPIIAVMVSAVCVSAAETTDEPSAALSQPGPFTITGFADEGHSVKELHLGEHLSKEEVASELPETITVLTSESGEQELTVSWICDDYEETEKPYYTFWAEWDTENCPLTESYGPEDYLPFADVYVDSGMLQLMSDDGTCNIVDRAYQQVNITYTPLSDVKGFYDNEDPLTMYYAGKTYRGIPYGQQISSGKYVPDEASFDEFLNSVASEGSVFYTTQGRYLDMYSTYYASDCSAFVSYAYGLSRVDTSFIAASSVFTEVGNSVQNAQVGDCMNMARHHVMLITGLEYDSSGNVAYVELSEQTPPRARTTIYTAEEAQDFLSKGGYTLLRYKYSSSVEAPYNYSGYASDQSTIVKRDTSSTDNVTLDFVRDSNDGTVYHATASADDFALKNSYVLAVWTTEGGQDDLEWISMTYNEDETYSCDIDTDTLLHSGETIVHMYRRNEYGRMHCLKMTSFSITQEPVSASELTITDVNSTSGTAKAVITGVSCESGVKSVVFPVWSSADQSDLVWYRAEDKGSGTWETEISIAKHDYHTGTYIVHAYGTNTNGKMNFIGEASFTIDLPEPVAEAKEDGDYIRLSVTGISKAGLKNLSAAVWSEENGQDDLKWYNLSYDAATLSASGSVLTTDHLLGGTVYIHFYKDTTDGKTVFLDGITLSIAEKARNELTCQYDNNTGDFTLTIKYPYASGKAITGIVVPTWADRNQKDIIWYEAEKSSDGSWKITGNVNRHGISGTYNLHAYARTKDGLVFLNKESFTTKTSADDLSIEETEAGLLYRISLSNMETPFNIKNVTAAVWSAENGQDDLKWYDMNKSGDGYAITADIRNHKTEGYYYVHIYVSTKSGKMVFAGDTGFDVNIQAECNVTAEEADTSDSSFTVTVTPVSVTGNITSVVVPVWCSSDQSDLHWYEAKKQPDGTWTATILRKNHKESDGSYKIHCYVRLENGIQKFAGAA